MIVPSASASRVSGIDGSSTRAGSGCGSGGGGKGTKGVTLELVSEQAESKSAKAATKADAILKTFFMPKLYHTSCGFASRNTSKRPQSRALQYHNLRGLASGNIFKRPQSLILVKFF